MSLAIAIPKSPRLPLKAVQDVLYVRDEAIASVGVVILITDPHQPDNPIIYVNPAFERLTGYGAADALGRNCRFLQGADTDPSAVAEIRQALKEERGLRVELLNYRKDGNSFWNDLTISPLRDATGRVTHYVG